MLFAPKMAKIQHFKGGGGKNRYFANKLPFKHASKIGTVDFMILCYNDQSGALYNTQVYTTFNMCITCVLYLKVRFCHLSTCVLHVYTTLLKMCTIVVYFSQ